MTLAYSDTFAIPVTVTTVLFESVFSPQHYTLYLLLYLSDISEISALFSQMATKERELHMTYNDSLAEMKGLLSAQKRVGAQWKGEMEILTKRFQVNKLFYLVFFVTKYLSGVWTMGVQLRLVKCRKRSVRCRVRAGR